MNNIEEFAQRLKELREKRGWTQAQLAEVVGVTPQTISAYENYKNGEKGKTPALDKAIAIAEALETSLDFLCGTNSQPNEYSLKNMANVVEHINILAKYFPCSIKAIKVDLPPEEWVPTGYENDGEIIYDKETLSVILCIGSYSLAKYAQSRNKIVRLVQDGTLDHELYATWRDGELEKLRKMAIAPSTPIYQTEFSFIVNYGDALETPDEDEDKNS